MVFVVLRLIRLIYYNFRFDQKIKTEANDLECKICLITFTTRANLYRHNLKHCEKIYMCHLCDNMYAIPSLLKQHIRITHDKNLGTQEESDHEQIRLICQFCSKVFKNRQYFKIHLKQHDPLHNRDKATCPQCSKIVDKYNLKKHMEVHRENRGYICDVCGKHIVSLGCMKIHMKVHTGEKNHICELCGKAFSKVMNLKTHMRVHTREKPFKCEECDKAFAQKSTLNIHMRRHTGEKFKCEFCSKQYVAPSGLKNHKCVV